MPFLTNDPLPQCLQTSSDIALSPPIGNRRGCGRYLLEVKRRFSELPGETARNQEETGGLEQGLDDEAEPVVAERQTPVLQQPGVAALDGPAALAEPRAARPATLVQP